MTSDADEKMLDAGLARVAATELAPSEALLDRVMRDADQVLAANAPSPVTPKASFGSFIQDVIGGWPTLSGLAAATVAGLWIGVAQPTSLTDLSAGLWGGTIEVPLLESDVFLGLEG